MMWLSFLAAVLVGGCSGQAAVWRGDCKLVDHSTEWHSLDMTIAAGKYRTVRLYLRLQRARGAMWFDRVEAPGLKVENPSFEQADGNDIAGWEQDDVGKTIFSDSTQAFDGRRCVLINRGQPGMSRIWQDLHVQPGKSYKIRVWAKWAGIFGNRSRSDSRWRCTVRLIARACRGVYPWTLCKLCSAPYTSI